MEGVKHYSVYTEEFNTEIDKRGLYLLLVLGPDEKYRESHNLVVVLVVEYTSGSATSLLIMSLEALVYYFMPF